MLSRLARRFLVASLPLLAVACGPPNVLDDATEAELDAVPCGRDGTMVFVPNGGDSGLEDAVTSLSSGPGWLEIGTKGGHRLEAHWEAPALFSSGSSFETQDLKVELALSDGGRGIICGRSGSAVRQSEDSDDFAFQFLLRDAAIGADCAESHLSLIHI